MDKRIVVSGIGVITSNGNNKEEYLNNLLNGVSGLKKCNLFDASRLKTEYVGEIENAEFPYLTENQNDKERITYIMERAIDEAFEDAKISVDEVSQYNERAYLAFATSLAANGRIMSYVRDERNGKCEPEWLTQIPSFVPWIKEKCGIKGGCYTTMSACAAGTTAAGIAYDLIQSGKADMVIAGGADPLTEFSCTGFHVLKSLSEGQCKPFDNNRDGINLGEGGAFFVIETMESAKKRGSHIYGEILGYGINNDAYHITSPSPDGVGALASMEMAMAHTEVSKDAVDYINAHGTGTSLNDKMEVDAINNFFGKDKHLYVASNKSMIGHCLAAGAVEMAATLLCLKNDCIAPNIRLTDKMDVSEAHDFLTEKVETKVNYALSNSYAFAGNTASILLGRVENE